MRTTRPGHRAPRRAAVVAVGLAAGLLSTAALAQMTPWPASPPAAGGAASPWPGDPPQSGGAGAPWPSSSTPRAGMAPSPAPMGAGPMTPVPPRAGGPGAGPGPAAGGQPPCMDEFSKLQAETDKRGKAAKAGVDKKVPREELCKLFQGFATAIGNWAKFARDKAPTCGIPPTIVTQLAAGSTNIAKNAKQVCAAGPIGAGPAGPPSLSEALGTASAPVTATPSGGAKPGTGTFNTLTGSSIAR